MIRVGRQAIAMSSKYPSRNIMRGYVTDGERHCAINIFAQWTPRNREIFNGKYCRRVGAREWHARGEVFLLFQLAHSVPFFMMATGEAP